MSEIQSPSKTKKIAYWICTGIIVFFMGTGGVLDAVSPPFVIEAMRHLGYPEYFARMLGVAKILGTVAILWPSAGTLREWAYAGFTFNLIAASIAHAWSQDGMGAVLFPLVLLGVMFGSYFLGKQIRRATNRDRS